MPNPSPETKDQIRMRMREQRRVIAPEDRMATGKAISKNVLGDTIRLLLRTWRVCIYLSTKNEIPTRYIARAFWEVGREVCVPAWSRSESAYKLYAFDPKMKLIKGHHGIREPAVHVPVMPWDVDAFILPGLAFDIYGGRLGYGAGHYDGILSKATPRAPKIALAYDWQILDTPLPLEAHDIAMDWIVSESRIVDCAKNRAQKKASPENGSPSSQNGATD